MEFSNAYNTLTSMLRPTFNITVGRSPLEFDKLYRNMNRNLKISSGLLKFLNFSKNFSIICNRNFIFESLISP